MNDNYTRICLKIGELKQAIDKQQRAYEDNGKYTHRLAIDMLERRIRSLREIKESITIEPCIYDY